MHGLARAAVAAGLMVLVSAAGAGAQDQAQNPGTALHTLFDDEQAFSCRESPLCATAAGVHSTTTGSNPIDARTDCERSADNKEFLDRLHAIDRAPLATEDQLYYDLFDFMIASRVRLRALPRMAHPAGSRFAASTARSCRCPSFSIWSDAGTTRTTSRDCKMCRAISTRTSPTCARAWPTAGRCRPRSCPGIKSIIDGEQYAKAEDSPLFKPFTQFPVGVPEADRTRLPPRREAAIEGPVRRVLRQGFKTFFDKGIHAGARVQTLGASALPNGKAYYADLVRYFTTSTSRRPRSTPSVCRGRAHPRGDGSDHQASSSFHGSFADFLAFLRTDPQFYEQDAIELMKHAPISPRRSTASCRNSSARLPRLPYRVEPVPADLAPNYTVGPLRRGAAHRQAGGALLGEHLRAGPAASVQPRLADAARGGAGHHLQISLAQELTGLPMFRRNLYLNAFGEGWGLYSEKLGIEMGIYTTPYENFGRLTLGDVARLPAGGRHRHPLIGLDAQAGAGLSGRKHRAALARNPHRSRPLHRLAGTGAVLQDGRTEDLGAAAQGRGRAGAEIRPPRLP